MRPRPLAPSCQVLAQMQIDGVWCGCWWLSYTIFVFTGKRRMRKGLRKWKQKRLQSSWTWQRTIRGRCMLCAVCVQCALQFGSALTTTTVVLVAVPGCSEPSSGSRSKQECLFCFVLFCSWRVTHSVPCEFEGGAVPFCTYREPAEPDPAQQPLKRLRRGSEGERLRAEAVVAVGPLPPSLSVC